MLIKAAGGENAAGRHLKAKFGWSGKGELGFWWSATESDDGNVYIRHISYEGGNVVRNSDEKEIFLSVRCAKD
jgi:hypothetical protein